MKRAGDIIAFSLQAVENFSRIGGFFGDDLDTFVFNGRSNFFRHAQVAGIPGADDKYLWFGGQYVTNVLGLQSMALLASPLRRYLSVNDF